MAVRKHFLFSGRVQGVGFRWNAVRLARPLGLTGWVRNLPDGRVELEAQGEEETIDRFLARLCAMPYADVEHIEARSVPTVRERDFDARPY